jgi:tetratricopeptide (TPR) repeat protein
MPKMARWSIWPGVLATFILGLLYAQSSPQMQVLLRDGQAALDRGDVERAVQDFEQARQLAPQNLQANRGLLLSYLQAGRLNEAAQLGREAVAHWPDDAQLQHWMGLVYFKSRQDSAALEALRRSEQLDGTKSEIHFDLALVLLDQNQYAQAADELERAIKLKPDNALAHVLAWPRLSKHESNSPGN